jgi:large subunit ribosomal protein L6e
MYRRSGRAQKKKSGVAWKVAPKKTPEVAQPKVKPFRKETRTIQPKGPHYYPEYDIPRPLKSRKHNHRPTRLRPSITPGTVLILLAGRFRAKRVVFLKQLPSGLLLITGPFKVNGVPLRRVNQAYVIATSTIVDISGISISKKFDDAYFTRPKKEKKKQTEEDFFASETTKKVLDKSRVEDQKELDKALLAVVSKEPRLVDYLHAKFSLSRNDRPHAMKF